MRLIGWGADNLFGYEHFDIYLKDLGRTVLLDGVNKDFASCSSNGAGKSSLIEVLCWVFFGQTIREVEIRDGKDAVIRSGASEGAHGWAEVALNDKKLVIHRYRANKAYSNGVEIYLDGQDVTKRYAKDTDKAIRSLLGLNFDIFTRAVVIHSWATRSFRSLNDRYLKYITERLVGMPDMDGLCKTVSTTLTSITGTIANLQFEIQRLDKDIDSKQKDLDSIKVMEKNYAEKRTQEIKEKLRTVSESIAEWNNEMQGFVKAFERIQPDTLPERLAKSSEALKAASKLHNDHLVTENTNKLMFKKYRNMKDATICPECNQQVGKQHITQLISLHETAYNSSRKQSLDSGAKLLQLEQEAEELAELRTNMSYLEGKRLETQERLEAAKEEKRALQLELQDKTNPFSELSEKATKELSKLHTEQKEKMALLSKKERTKQYYDFWKVGFGPDGMRAYMLDSVTPDLNKLANTYLSELTDGTVSVELSTVTPRKDGSYRDKFSVTIDNSIGSRYFAGNSDGEIACLDLALNFAMSDILECRLDGGLGILYIDQAIDLVDPVRGDKAIALLNRRVDEKWCSEVGIKPKYNIFVISHRQEFKDRFESTIFVEKENGVCRLP